VQAVKPEVIAGDKWKPLPAEPNGKLDLKPAFGTATGQAVYVRAYVFAPKKQKASVAVESENPWRAWVNGVTADPAKSFDVELKEGWNVLLVKVANAGKPATLGVRVNGDGLRTAASPDGLPAGGQ
jgi:hypothetical protein